MIRIVLDTNVLMSAHLKNTGAEARVFDLVTNQLVSLCVTAPILTEYEGVLSRRKFRIDKERVKQSMDLIRRVAVLATLLGASQHRPMNPITASWNAPRKQRLTILLQETSAISRCDGKPRK